MKIEANKIICSDALTGLEELPKKCIDMCITSPPYWGLRDYQTGGIIWDTDDDCEHDFKLEIKKDPMDRGGCGQFDEGMAKSSPNKPMPHSIIKSGFCKHCGAWRGELGLEPDMNLYINHLCDIFDEVKRVLKDTGTCWVNIGDSYASQGGLSKPEHLKKANVGATKSGQQKGMRYITKDMPVPNKSLCCIPERFKIEMINRGWICRNTIIWKKPNCMPSSASDRFTIDFEYIYFFSKQQKYYFEQQFEPHKRDFSNEGGGWENGKYKPKENTAWKNDPSLLRGADQVFYYNPQGRNKRCVWDITTKGFSEAHFATFPEALLETPIKAGCPQYICKRCGMPRMKIYENEFIPQQDVSAEKGLRGVNNQKPMDKSNNWQGFPRGTTNHKLMGYTDCGCNAEFIGGIILDPFIGSGTSAVKAKKMGRRYLGFDINQEYVEMAKARVNKIHIRPSIRGKL